MGAICGGGWASRGSGAAAVTAVFAACWLTTVAGCRNGARHPGALQGVVEFDERILSFEMGGRLQMVDVDEGDTVTEGQVLAKLDASLEDAVLAAQSQNASAAAAQQKLLKAGARSEEIRAMAQRLAAAKAKEQYLSKTLARHRKLEGGIGATPAAQVDSIAMQLRAATADRKAIQQQLAILRKGARPEELSSAGARAAAATAGVTLERERLKRHTLRAPIAGTVLDVPMDVGETVAPGTPVVTIADTRHPYADVFVPQGKLDGIRVGSPARLYVDARPEPFPGKVEYVSRRTEFTPRFLFSERERPNLVIRVRVRIEDPKQALHAGVPAFVYIDPQPTKTSAPATSP